MQNTVPTAGVSSLAGLAAGYFRIFPHLMSIDMLVHQAHILTQEAVNATIAIRPAAIEPQVDTLMFAIKPERFKTFATGKHERFRCLLRYR